MGDSTELPQISRHKQPLYGWKRIVQIFSILSDKIIENLKFKNLYKLALQEMFEDAVLF